MFKFQTKTPLMLSDFHHKTFCRISIYYAGNCSLYGVIKLSSQQFGINPFETNLSSLVRSFFHVEMPQHVKECSYCRKKLMANREEGHEGPNINTKIMQDCEGPPN